MSTQDTIKVSDTVRVMGCKTEVVSVGESYTRGNETIIPLTVRDIESGATFSGHFAAWEIFRA
jgi:hypothetical protein